MLTRCPRSSASTSSPPAIVVTPPPPPAIATMAVQDDLATLFAKNLTLTQQQYHSQQQQEQQQQQPSPPEDPTRIVYISQHYTHSAHVHQQPVQRPASEPDLADLEHVLRAQGVDAAALSPPQAELFRRADDAQRARLVELWTICPPLPPAAHHPSSLTTWSPTSVEQEEMLARRRWEDAQQQNQQQQQQQQHISDDVAMSLDDDDMSAGTGSPASVQSPDGRWPPASSSSSPAVVAHAHTYMEPYMESGYEQLARREYEATATACGKKTALDPVYKATGMLDWERQQWMENQYGSFVGGWRDDEDML